MDVKKQRPPTPVIEVPWDVFEAIMDTVRSADTTPVCVGLADRPSLVLWADPLGYRHFIIRPTEEVCDGTDQTRSWADEAPA